MVLEIPQSIEAEGSLLAIFVPSGGLANPAAPTEAELSAPTALPFTCFITDDNLKPKAEDQTQDRRRLCSKETFEGLGKRKLSWDDIVYVYNPQEPASPENKLYAALPRGTAGFFVLRWGKDVEEFPEAEAGDIVDVHRIKAGSRNKQPITENGELTVAQKIIATGPSIEDVAVA